MVGWAGWGWSGSGLGWFGVGLVRGGSGQRPGEAVGSEVGDARRDEAIGRDGLGVCGGESELEEVTGDGFCGAVGADLDSDGGERAAEEAGAEGVGFCCDEGAERGHALLNGASGDGIFAVEFPGAGIGARGEREEVEVGKGLRGNEIAAFLEEGVGFAGKADHDVGADGGIGEQSANGGEALGVVPGAIAAVHAAQDGVRTGLEGQVGVGG